MTLYEYVEEALKTESALNPLSEAVQERGVSPRILHSLIGVETEISELDEALRLKGELEIFEELSDILWYTAIAIDELALKYNDDNRNEIIMSINSQIKEMRFEVAPGIDYISECVSYIIDKTGAALDQYKKAMFYGKDLNENPDAIQKILFEWLFFNVFMVKNILEELDNNREVYTLANCYKANILKLKARYPDKFQLRDAETRDVEKEYEAMRTALGS